MINEEQNYFRQDDLLSGIERVNWIELKAKSGTLDRHVKSIKIIRHCYYVLELQKEYRK